MRSVVVVTSDKCYENREWPYGPIRGNRSDGWPSTSYSSSKSVAAELVTAAYRRSFFSAQNGRMVGIATARAGNVIGGGDWAEDRLLPDCIKALSAGRDIEIRNPHAVRPWQHVLEPLSGYLLLAERLNADAGGFGDAWNLGPVDEDARPVAWIASRIVERWGKGAGWASASGDAPHETTWLKVDASRARMKLGWAPRLRLAEGLDWTIEWHQRLNAGESARAVTDAQLSRYCEMDLAE